MNNFKRQFSKNVILFQITSVKKSPCILYFVENSSAERYYRQRNEFQTQRNNKHPINYTVKINQTNDISNMLYTRTILIDLYGRVRIVGGIVRLGIISWPMLLNYIDRYI